MTACLMPGRRVLVVDDEPDARALVRRLLEHSGATVTAAGSADVALNELRAKTFDVIVSDIGMPKVDGYSLMRDVRALAPDAPGRDVPAIALTAYARSEDRDKTAAAGFQAHVAKPVEIAELVRQIARVIRTR